jgi:hypothetical protein
MAKGLGLAMLAAAAALATLAAPARADAIDGDWCADDGRHLSIRGPAITTPGGIETDGDYARHAFNYVVPEGEASAGQSVAMTLLNENTVDVQADGRTETWLRCKPAIS